MMKPALAAEPGTTAVATAATIGAVDSAPGRRKLQVFGHKMLRYPNGLPQAVVFAGGAYRQWRLPRNEHAAAGSGQ